MDVDLIECNTKHNNVIHISVGLYKRWDEEHGSVEIPLIRNLLKMAQTEYKTQQCIYMNYTYMIQV